MTISSALFPRSSGAAVAFRDAVREDVPAVVALLREDALGSARGDQGLTRYLAAFDEMQAESGNRLLVGEHNGRIVATYQLIVISGLSRRALRRAQVESVRVASSLRSRGIGAALMADAEARAREAGCGLIQLTSDASRREAHAFYRRLGYLASHVGFKRRL